MSILATPDVEFLQDLLKQRSGHVISAQQSYLFDSRLESVVSAEGLESLEALVTKARTSGSPRIADSITEAMTINETFFFRDAHPFEAFQHHLIPKLLQAREHKKELSIWAGACSSGQEPYSIAMVLRECFPALVDWKIKILATDISDEILAKAEKGEFSQFEVNRGLPARMLIKNFERKGSSWFVKDELKEMLEFKKVNLTKTWPIYHTFDVVFLRNVLIYFSSETKEAILKQVRSVMADDGYLFLGGGECLLRIDAPFKREAVEQTICYRPTN